MTYMTSAHWYSVLAYEARTTSRFERRWLTALTFLEEANAGLCASNESVCFREENRVIYPLKSRRKAAQRCSMHSMAAAVK